MPRDGWQQGLESGGGAESGAGRIACLSLPPPLTLTLTLPLSLSHTHTLSATLPCIFPALLFPLASAQAALESPLRLPPTNHSQKGQGSLVSGSACSATLQGRTHVLGPSLAATPRASRLESAQQRPRFIARAQATGGGPP